MAYDYEQQRREQEAQRAQQQRNDETRASQARQEASRLQAHRDNEANLNRQRNEAVDQRRRENTRNEEQARARNDQRRVDDQNAQTRLRRDEADRQQAQSAKDRPNGKPWGGAPQTPYGAAGAAAGALPQGPWGASGGGASATSMGVGFPGHSRGASVRASSPPFLKLFVGFIIFVMIGLAAVGFLRGNLVFHDGHLTIVDYPMTQTSEGPAYRHWDMYISFRNTNSAAMPVEVVPNSYIEIGSPIPNARILCPHGDFQVKGDLIDSRIIVPNGTLTVDGNVSGSSLTARRVVTHGRLEKTIESATHFTNTGKVIEPNALEFIPDGHPIVEDKRWLFGWLPRKK